ncbi:MAG: RNA polymerase factor sigma-54 [Lawsonibacter sp.]|nr:RNA polymerase factor sigma-54 [Lawsonibacter sp.]
MELMQTQSQQLNYQQLQGVALLQMGSLELEQYLRELAQDNPMVDLEAEAPVHEGEDRLLQCLRWLEDNDRQNLYYQQMSEEELDPLSRVGNEGGLEETLFRFLSRQLYPMELDESTANAVRYLASCLDGRGYLSAPLAELAESSRIPLPRLECALEILRGLEPAGVGAETLSQCLELQLRRIREEGPALEIVRHHLELLAKRHYPSIAAKLSISVEQVKAAEAIIRELDPRPGAVFERAEQIPYILPDIFVEEEDGVYIARARKPARPPFQINGYYRRLLLQSQDPQVKEYLKEKLQQAEGVLRAVEQRESTLLRCAQAIVDAQREFFRSGPQALFPLRMADVAASLELHESTVSRAVREKHIQCAQGVYPMSYFFSRSAAVKKSGARVAGTAARLMLKQLIDQEDQRSPLSDQKLSTLLEQAGCPISRRTVAKYRGELNIPDQSGRRLR